MSSAEDEKESIEAEIGRLFRHAGDDPLMMGVKAALLEFRLEHDQPR